MALIFLEKDQRHFMCKGASSLWMNVLNNSTGSLQVG
jgi:hypothetical protein